MDAFKVRQKLEEAAGATGLQQLRAHAAQSMRRIKAEDEVAMRALGGKMESSEAEEMGDVVIGDSYTTNSPSAFGQLAGQALLAAAIGGPLAAVAWKYLDKPPAQPASVVQEDQDTVNKLKILR